MSDCLKRHRVKRERYSRGYAGRDNWGSEGVKATYTSPSSGIADIHICSVVKGGFPVHRYIVPQQSLEHHLLRF